MSLVRAVVAVLLGIVATVETSATDSHCVPIPLDYRVSLPRDRGAHVGQASYESYW